MGQVLRKFDPNPPNVDAFWLYKAKKHLDKREFFYNKKKKEMGRDYPPVRL